MFYSLVSATILGTFTTEMSLVATVVARPVNEQRKKNKIVRFTSDREMIESITWRHLDSCVKCGHSCYNCNRTCFDHCRRHDRRHVHHHVHRVHDRHYHDSERLDSYEPNDRFGCMYSKTVHRVTGCSLGQYDQCLKIDFDSN